MYIRDHICTSKNQLLHIAPMYHSHLGLCFFQGPTRTRFSAALLYQQGEESADLGCCNTGIAG